jgi:hypothetical protein
MKCFGAFLLCAVTSVAVAADSPTPFGDGYPQLDSWVVGEWWKEPWKGHTRGPKRKRPEAPPFPLDVPRDEVVAFALYTVDVKPAGGPGVLKVTAQLYPLKPGEPREARLELKRGEVWEEVSKAQVLYPGWDVHFRVDDWDATKAVPYRVRHGDTANFEGLVRADPIGSDRITVAVLSCNSSRTPGERQELVDGLRNADPDLLFFAGDQTYRHTEHTVGWIEFGLQFRDVMRDRPTVTLPDDHDVGHHNLWGASGKKSKRPDGDDGGYFYPASYVNMVQRQQAWHLPDPVDPDPVQQGITVYFTRLVLGSVDFAIVEDRKFKTGPSGTIPKMGPRPDHIVDPSYDRKAIDLPGLELLGRRQLDWLARWAEDWKGVRAKSVLSQTAFCGAVHLHGSPKNRLLADLDCNGWPQSGRNAALRILKSAKASHLCGDQHLAVVVQHGIDEYRDGPWAFTAPALVNTIYGRWWHPLNEQAGANAVPRSPLPWTGDYEDGLGNKITMIAYANPGDIKDEKQRGDGYGIARWEFAKPGAGRAMPGTLTFECWPRFPVTGPDGKPQQFPGWPVVTELPE